MSLQYVNATDLADVEWGFDTPEAGINVEGVTNTYNNERQILRNPTGGTRGFVTNIDPNRVADFSGEIDDTTGLGALAGFNVAATLANAETRFGIGSSGDDFLDTGVNTTRNREGWYMLNGSVTLFDQLTAT